MSSQRRTDILFAVTAAVTAEAFLVGQLRAVSEVGRVALVVGDEVPRDLIEAEGVEGFSIGLSRDPSPMSDAAALGRLVRLLRQLGPQTVVFGTPKMGLLAAIATFVCRTPRRVYVIHGFRWEGSSGWRRYLLTRLDALACLFATDVVAVSASVRDLAIGGLRVDSAKVRLMHHGSANGIDSQRFAPIRGAQRAEVRQQLRLPTEGLVAVFAGRLTRDKGIQQLGDVWNSVVQGTRDAHLVVVGKPEPSEVADSVAIEQLAAMDSVSVWPATDAMETLLGCADINLSLSRREGMPTVVLEAASCEVPTVAYRATGTVDAVSPGTGTLVALDDVSEYVRAVIALANNESERIVMGRSARARVVANFAPADVWRAWTDFLTASRVTQ
jgi:glycosyltransferase involved in cell wall biosynthesis